MPWGTASPQPPHTGREELVTAAADLINNLKALNVDTLLGKEADIQLIKDMSPDAVVIARAPGLSCRISPASQTQTSFRPGTFWQKRQLPAGR